MKSKKTFAFHAGSHSSKKVLAPFDLLCNSFSCAIPVSIRLLKIIVTIKRALESC